MPVVTGLPAAKRRSGYIQVFVDGVSAGSIRQEDAVRLDLVVGLAVDESIVDEIRSLSARAEALQKADRFLAFRPRTVREVQVRLQRAGLDAEDIEATIEALTTQGLLDDKRFADMWVENRSAFSPRSPRMLANELRRKGVDRLVIEDTLEGASGVAETALAIDAGRRRVHRYERVDRKTFEQTLGAFLGRRGFGHESIRSALEVLWSEIEHEGDGSDTDPDRSL